VVERKPHRPASPQAGDAEAAGAATPATGHNGHPTDEALAERFLADPHLPGLRMVLSPVLMGLRLEAHFHASGLPQDWSVTGCAVEQIYYKPHRHCGVLHRVTLRGRGGLNAEEWVFGQAFAPEIGPQRFAYLEACVSGLRPACPVLAGIPVVGYWDDLHIAISLFPHDRKMPGVHLAGAPQFVRRVLETHAEAREAFGSTAASAAIEFDRLKYMPGKRCVLRYRLTWPGIPEITPRASFISKTFPAHEARHAYERLRAACDAWASHAPAIDIPRPLAYLEEGHTAWLEDWGGAPLVAVVASGDGAAHLERAAALLAAIHRSRVEGLPAGPDRDAVVRAATQDLDRYARLMPEHEAIVAALRACIESGAQASVETPRVPIHGDFQVEQLLVRDGRLTAVDFDDLAQGDPLQDVAEFVASLRYLEISAGRPRGELARAAAAFCARYAGEVPWHCDPGRIAWYAAAYTATKMSWTVAHLDLAAISRLLARGATLVQDMLEGWE